MNRWTASSLGALALAPLVLSGCTRQASAHNTKIDAYPLPAAKFPLLVGKDPVDLASEDAKKEKVREKIAAVLGLYFGSPENPRSPFAGTEIDERAVAGVLSSVARSDSFVAGDPLRKGRDLYKLHCVHCHGFYGAGDGPTAEFLLPKPRDFRKGELKFTSTKEGMKPKLDDIRRTIAQGIPGTMMPAFGPPDGIPELGIVAGHAGPPGFDVDAVSQYVRVLLMRGEVEYKLVADWDNDPNEGSDCLKAPNVKERVEGVIALWKAAEEGELKPETQRPVLTGAPLEESVNKGREIYRSQVGDCVKCHGLKAEGDGLGEDLSKRPLDVWGDVLRPANLNLGVYRGGRRPIDLYRRIRAGVKGNVMPAFPALTPEQVWNVVDYLQSLPVEHARASSTK